MVAGRRHKWRDDITVAIAEGNHLVALYFLVATETKVVPAFLRRSRRAVAMNDRGIEQARAMKDPDRCRENRIKAAMRFPIPEHAINPGMVNLRMPLLVLLNRQLLPLAAQIQKPQNIVEDRVQRQLRCRATPPGQQVGQDKFLKLLHTQIRWNPLPLLALRHFLPPKQSDFKRGDCYRLKPKPAAASRQITSPGKTRNE